MSRIPETVGALYIDIDAAKAIDGRAPIAAWLPMQQACHGHEIAMAIFRKLKSH
jgi:hypothetical protein